MKDVSCGYHSIVSVPCKKRFRRPLPKVLGHGLVQFPSDKARAASAGKKGCHVTEVFEQAEDLPPQKCQLITPTTSFMDVTRGFDRDVDHSLQWWAPPGKTYYFLEITSSRAYDTTIELFPASLNKPHSPPQAPSKRVFDHHQSPTYDTTRPCGRAGSMSRQVNIFTLVMHSSGSCFSIIQNAAARVSGPCVNGVILRILDDAMTPAQRTKFQKSTASHDGRSHTRYC